MMTYSAGFLIGAVLAVIVDGSPIISSLDQPTPFKYTFRVEKLEFGNGLEDCAECEGEGGIIIGNEEEHGFPVGDQGVEVCNFLKKACINEDYLDEEFKKYPQTYKIFLLACGNYDYICGGNEPDGSFIPDYPDIDEGARVCMELEKACGDEIYPDEIKDNPEAKRMFSLICKNLDYVCGDDGEDEAEEAEDSNQKPDDSLLPENPDDVQRPEFCNFLKKACDNEDYIDEDFTNYTEPNRMYLLACKNYEYICGEGEPEGVPDDSSIPDYAHSKQGDNVCESLNMACDDEYLIDKEYKDKPEEKKMFLLFCENYDYICGEYEDGKSSGEDIYSEDYEEIFHIEEDDYYEDEADEEEGGNEQKEDKDEEDNEI